MNPRSLENLRPFAPGQSGNPRGRPKSPLTDAARKVLADPAKLEGILQHWLRMIAGGNSAALRELLDRVEGKVSDRVEHDGQVTIRVEYADGPDAHDHPAEAAPGTGEDTGEPGEVPGAGVRP